MASASSNITISTYDTVAGRDLELWRDRSAVREHMDRFAAMLTAYGLDRQPMLDVGCGPGFDTVIFRDLGLRVIGVDLSPSMLSVSRQDYPRSYLLADRRFLPVAPCIGGLWVSASLLHLNRSDIPTTLEHFASALLPGGLLYLSLKIGKGAGWDYQPYKRPRHFTYWCSEGLDPLLEDTGQQIIDAWEGDGEIDRWLVRFARKKVHSAGISLPCSGSQDY